MTANTASPTPNPGLRDDAITRVVHANRARLCRVARGEGLSPADAVDAVQDAFVSLLALPQARLALEAPAEATNLLVALTRNIARNRRRLHAVARPHERTDATLEALPADDVAVDDLLDRAEETVRLHGCLRQLADLQRSVVTLRMLDEVAGEDVARTLAITPGHVAVLLHRAKASLASCMSAEPPCPTRP